MSLSWFGNDAPQFSAPTKTLQTHSPRPPLPFAAGWRIGGNNHRLRNRDEIRKQQFSNSKDREYKKKLDPFICVINGDI